MNNAASRLSQLATPPYQVSMWKYLGFFALLAGASSLGQQAGLEASTCGGSTGCLRSLPSRSSAVEQSDANLNRRRRQQQIVQEVIVENNFGGPGFGGPGFGGPGFGGPGFGRPGFGGPGFGGPGFGGPGFGRGKFGFARSYDQDEAQVPAQGTYQQQNTLSEVPSPACPKNYVFSCEAVIKPVPCGHSSY
ncbi:chorion class CA protein ERA.1 [Drosophila simulans]|uniref:VM domain-containing protein n=2 Tax=Drosophila simulans TaxID=7240 RepID=A0A0J9QWG2_DROSI|nr:chorion class CA protein ERA.1 [Drosophila simulans]KMY88412.1 uncharacterized protein Dsimw501_GD22621 [Drosophila simulans]